MNPITVLVVDDHPVFRFGMTALLSSVPQTHVVGEATTGSEAIALTDELHPDVILMDIKMPDMTGIEATRQIHARHADIGILVVTMLGEDDSVFAAMRAGARGYLLKGAPGGHVLRAIQSVADGEAVFDREIARRIAHFFATPATAVAQAAFPELTPREGEVLLLLARGHGNAQIAQRLLLSQKTVRNHVSSIFNKMQVVGREEAIVRAREAGLE